MFNDLEKITKRSQWRLWEYKKKKRKEKNLNEMIETIEDTKEDINKETELLKTCQAEINFTWKPPGVSLTRMKERILGLIVKVNKMNCEVKKMLKKTSHKISRKSRKLLKE